MKQPFRCPVCDGRGSVRNGFYYQTPGTYQTRGTADEPCRSCNGKGIVFGQDNPPPEYCQTKTTVPMGWRDVHNDESTCG